MILDFLQIVGSLGLFLYGMKVMSDGIQKAAGERLHTILGYMTTNRFTAVLTGFTITALIQSSSATTVMVVGFVNAGLLTLVQAIGVIMGANIGTTVTGWIVALLGFKIKLYIIALPAIGLGMFLLLAKKLGKRALGEALIGFGLLFLGLKSLKDAVPDISQNPLALEFLTGYTGMGLLSFVIFVVAGTIVTIIVQSSSAAMAITLTMAYTGWIDFPTAAAIVLGENIGTTVTAYLASINTNIHARRAARAHMLFNIFGILWMMFLFKPFLSLTDAIVPGEIAGKDSITAHLAMFHTLFNIANTVICIGFVKQFAILVEKLVRLRADEKDTIYRLKYITTGLQETPELNIMNAKQELSKMAGITEKMFSVFLDVFANPRKNVNVEIEKLKEMEEYTDQMQEEISRFLVECLGEKLNEISARNANTMIRIADELESIGDSSYNLILLIQRCCQKKIKFSPKAIEEIIPFTRLVQEFLEFNIHHLNEHLSEVELLRAYEIEDHINQQRNNLKKRTRKRLKKGSHVKTELLYIDIIRQIERIGDYSLNVSQALRNIR